MRTTKAKRGLRLAAPLLVAAVVAAGCDDDDALEPVPGTIAEVAAATSQLSTLVAALDAADLVETVDEGGPFTVFAPVNAAFEALGAGTVEALLASGNAAILADLLTYHVVAGEVRASELSDGQTLTTVEGGTLAVTVEGGTVRIDGVAVTTADVEASNGVVHLIGGVLTGGLDVVQRATVTPGFGTLVDAVVAAGLADELSAAGPYTVFAPTDAAFAALGGVPSDPAVLAEVLLYHVVPAAALSGSLSDGQTLTTLQGGTLTVDLDGGVTIVGARNSAAVAAADVVVSNGVIHAVDAVLLPPQ